MQGCWAHKAEARGTKRGVCGGKHEMRCRLSPLTSALPQRPLPSMSRQTLQLSKALPELASPVILKGCRQVLSSK